MILLWEFVPPSGLCRLILWGTLHYFGGGAAVLELFSAPLFKDQEVQGRRALQPGLTLLELP